MTKKLSQLPEHSGLTSTGTFIVVDNGATLRYPFSALNNYIVGGGVPVSELINGDAVVSLGSDGVLTLPVAVMGPLFGPGSAIDVSTATGNFYNILSINEFNGYVGMAAFGGPGSESTAAIMQTYDGVSYYGWTFQPDGRTSFPNYTFPASTGTAAQILVNDGDGSLVWQDQSNSYTLTTATSSLLGGVKIGTGITITSDGTISATTATSYTLTTATANILGGVKIGSGVNVANDGTISVTTGSYTLTTATTSTLGGVKIDGTSITINNGTISSSVAGLGGRAGFATSTITLTSGTSTTTNIVGYKGYALLSIHTSFAAWVTVYSSTATMAADSGRSIATDPTAGSGVIAETITTGSATTYFSPGVIGYSSESIPTTSIPLKIYNNGTSASVITVTLTLLKLEA